MKIPYRILILSSVFLSCKSVSPTAARLDSATTFGPTELQVEALRTVADFEGFSVEAAGLAQSKRTLKFLIDARSTPKIYFINGNYSGRCQIERECNKFHFGFAREFLNIRESNSEFNDATYTAEKKRYVAGTLNTYDLGSKGLIYGIQLYPLDTAKEGGILEIVKTVKAALQIPNAKLAFVSTGNQQTMATIKAQLDSLGVLSLDLQSILGSVTYFPMNSGEAWGYLRLFPKDEASLEAKDIPVFDQLPLDLTVVAASITKAFQDSNSHINLKSKERNTPNMVLRDAGPDHPILKKFIDKPVHLVVSAQGWKIEESTDAIVMQNVQKRANRPWIPLSWTAGTEVQSFDAMCSGKAASCLKLAAIFGSKASNLGFLKESFRDRRVAGQTLDYDPVPIGFGVPMQFYKDLIDLPANAAMKTKLQDLITREKNGTLKVSDRNAIAAEIRQMILDAEVPAANLQKILAIMQKLDSSIIKWKLRSSANAEDVENFDGAGLHDSYAAKLDKTDKPDHKCILKADTDDGESGELVKMEVSPKTVACAMKGVYASLWNKRAIEERTFARIDHASVAMGLAVLPTYDTEAPVTANSVVVTRVINAPEVIGYSLSIQKDNNTVTNPTPGTWSEVVIAAMGVGDEPSFTTMRFAKPTANSPELKEAVMKKEEMLMMTNLVKKIEVAYCRAKPEYYPRGDCNFVPLDSSKPKSLDMEMKYLQNGHFVLKQVREFGGK